MIHLFICLLFATSIAFATDSDETFNLRIDPDVRVLHVYDGQTVVLKCSIDTVSKPHRIGWRRNGIKITTNGTYSIANMTAADAGMYICEAEEQYWGDRKNITLEFSPMAINTTQPGAPEQVNITKLAVRCVGHNCELSWPKPEDNGASITNYTVDISQANAAGPDAFNMLLVKETTNNSKIVVTVPALNATYQLRIVAANANGTSQVAETQFKPDGTPSDMWKWLIIALAGVLLLLLLICYSIIFVMKRRRNLRGNISQGVRGTKKAEESTLRV